MYYISEKVGSITLSQMFHDPGDLSPHAHSGCLFDIQFYRGDNATILILKQSGLQTYTTITAILHWTEGETQSGDVYKASTNESELLTVLHRCEDGVKLNAVHTF